MRPLPVLVVSHGTCVLAAQAMLSTHGIYQCAHIAALGPSRTGAVFVVVHARHMKPKGAARGTTITEVASAALIPILLERSDREVVPAMTVVARVALTGAAHPACEIFPAEVRSVSAVAASER